MKRTIKLVTSVLLAFVMLVGCAPKEKVVTDNATTTEAAAATTAATEPVVEEKEPVEISITYATGDQKGAEVLHQSVVDFMTKYPHVTIVEKLSNEGAYLDSIKTLDAVGEFPDIIEMRDTALYARAEKLGELPAEITDLFTNTVAFDGKIYTAPLNEAYANGVIYNKSIFNEVGIKAEDIKTYDDFLAACEKIKATGVAPIVVGGSDIWHIGFWWSYFWLNDVANESPNWIADRYAGKVHFTDDNVKTAMNGLNDLFQTGYIEQGWASTAESQCPSILIAEQAAMYYTGPFSFAQITEADPSFEYGFFALPNNKGELNVTGGVTAQGWAINAETQKNDPAKTEAVYLFMKEFFQKDAYTNYVKATGSAPSLKEEITYEASEQMLAALAISKEATSKQLNWNQGIGTNELPPNFRNFCYKLVSEWFFDVSTVEDGLKTMDSEWENATKDFNPVLNPAK